MKRAKKLWCSRGKRRDMRKYVDQTRAQHDAGPARSPSWERGWSLAAFLRFKKPGKWWENEGV